MDKEHTTLTIVQEHYQDWTDDRNIRMERENGWNDVLDAYFGKLPEDWPYLSRVTDPRLRTTLIEKKARLTNSKLRGRLTPREGGDIVGARVNNALLDFQWDNANEGGSMNHKWGQMDMDARMFESGYGLVTWKYECEKEDDETKTIFNGNEFMPIDPRNVGHISGRNVRDAKWIQISEYLTLEELETENQIPGKPKYPGLAELKSVMADNAQDRRDNQYTSRIKSLKGLQDYIGEDEAFPVIEVVTEYRKDRWITFSPRHNVILRDIENPYKHGKIPIVQLKYYPLSDDARGESEVEAVLPLWRAIQATLCGYIDSMNMHMKPPLKVVDGAVRVETIEYGPEAMWVMDSLDAVQEHQGSSDPLRYFQQTYSALVSAFNTAMGDASQGVGGIDPFNPDKTATEVKDIAEQRNVRDQDNQNNLADALKDMMSMWMSNNRQFLFADEDMHEYVLKIIGEKDFAFFKEQGLDAEVLDQASTQMIGDVVSEMGGDVSDLQLQEMVNAGSIPKYPVIENPGETDPDKINLKPKMTIDESGKEAELYLVPEDLEGNYNYIPDVKSMSAGADQDMRRATQQATELLFNNQAVLSLLQQEGVRPNTKEILMEQFENAGTRDASRYFTQISQAGVPGQGAQDPTGLSATMEQPGFPGALQQPGPSQQMVGSPAVQGQPGIPAGL